MAKSKKSIWDVPQEEVAEVAKQVQQEAMNTLPAPKVAAVEEAIELPKIEKVEKVDKLQIVYVDTPHHTQAKINAAMRGMKLGKYLEFLIEQDKKNLL